ncbi:uncharacterized protein BO88DRAFT_183141 [Aspergillus vadensis CBS 113365]|uniref:Uncharacterized protein n=1 Tax=Aspergillus vadensis (strain CBS 113365 / IMI 142717 / IBT 24658) TaxID=1448311 RepID=A0A319C5R8_ASPVC|nr:hypothetical protein BO88DRAFT_183141 [Aspergillus vadensis CBS 113365]PYH64152.1 hypothetical protein BO88DRAFT_183141 [Aspergillus vadensis CBS 113365]
MWREFFLLLKMTLMILVVGCLSTSCALYIVVSGSLIVIVMSPRTELGSCVVHLRHNPVIPECRHDDVGK